jgi:hypothetical protein
VELLTESVGKKWQNIKEGAVYGTMQEILMDTWVGVGFLGISDNVKCKWFNDVRDL